MVSAQLESYKELHEDPLSNALSMQDEIPKWDIYMPRISLGTGLTVAIANGDRQIPMIGKTERKYNLSAKLKSIEAK